MKKIYLSAILLGITATSSMAQINTSTEYLNPANDVSRKTLNKPALPASESKAVGAVIWSDNFDDGSNWTLDHTTTGADPITAGWTIDANVDTWWSGGGINSVSGGGFAELNNSDGTGAQSGVNDSVTYTMTSIVLDIPNLPGNTNNSDQVTLEFNQTGAQFNDLQEVQISTNGTGWTTIRNNRDFYTTLSSAGGERYPDPDFVSINLAPYITGNANTVQIRFSWTTAFPASADNPIAWIAYGWAIDDLVIRTSSDNDLEATLPFWGTAGLFYHQIPTTQIAPISFASKVLNNGLNDQTGAMLNVDVNSGAWTGTSPSATILAGSSDSLIVSTDYTPAATPGTHTFTWNITQNEIDDVPANNIIDGNTFDITPSVYARDNGNVDGNLWNSGNGFETGNLYDIWADQLLERIDVQLATSAAVGALIYVKVYSIDPTTGDFVLEDQSDYYEVTANDVLGTTIPLFLLNGVTLTAANQTYLVTVGSDGDGGVSNDLTVATAGTSEPQTTFYFDATDATWYYTTSTPIVRMNFDRFAGISENTPVSAVNVFPNPANDVVNVAFNLGANSDVTVELVDVAGKVISTKTVANAEGNQTSSFNTEALNGGVYFVNITSNDSSITKKFIKQ